MILVPLLLAAVGVADLTRLSGSGASWSEAVRAACASAAMLLLGSLGVGLGWHALWIVPAGTAIVLAWCLLSSPTATATPARPVALMVLVAPLLLALALGQHLPATTGWLHDWYASLAIPGLGGVTFERFAMATAVFVFLQATANVVVRLVLTSSDPGLLSLGGAPRGGRILGPLERSFLFAFALAGEYAPMAAIIAAKGVLRFPEVSGRGPGDARKAEYVLVGSFLSWFLALVFVPLVK